MLAAVAGGGRGGEVGGGGREAVLRINEPVDQKKTTRLVMTQLTDQCRRK